ncbi:hypothetical protein [Acaryochloris thomasi]|uniref:hypothetical protein n=1 Tax=Acaryochloris thomasi TaxID=2929456 RepID=UPI0011B38BB8|nr:hypothetical protein [Acaryochloris thomasi]
MNSVYAAQLDFQDPFQGDASAQPSQADIDADLCEEDFSPVESELNSLNLGPNLVASAVVSDTPLLIAQGPICDLGGVAPEGGGALGAGIPLLPVLGGLAGAGGIAAVAATGGGDGDGDAPAPPTPAVPEPAELATASLFATLGVAGVLLRRKKKSEDV